MDDLYSHPCFDVLFKKNPLGKQAYIILITYIAYLPATQTTRKHQILAKNRAIMMIVMIIIDLTFVKIFHVPDMTNSYFHSLTHI